MATTATLAAERAAATPRALARACAVALTCMIAASCTVSPQRFSDAEVDRMATASLQAVSTDQEKVKRPIDLYEAMARALKYNLDFRVAMMEKALRVSSLRLTHHGMLPDLVARSGYHGRSNYAGSDRRLLSNPGLFQNRGDLGATNVASSTAQDRNSLGSDLSFSWNILDFGLSYVRAKQAADEVLIAEQLKRRAINRIIAEVRTAYWRAVSYERLIGQLHRLRKKVEAALAETHSGQTVANTSEITRLAFERELVEITRELQQLEGDLRIAKAELAALMALPPGTRFRLVKGVRTPKTLRLPMTPRRMVDAALRHRPELREIQYRQRINAEEAEAALLELLPSFSAFVGLDHSTNSFLTNNAWLGWGSRASWNLLNVFSYPSRKAVVAARSQLLDARAKAMAMAIVTQVHVSRLRFLHHRAALRTAARYFQVQTRLLQKIEEEAKADRISGQTLIREELNQLVANVKYDIAYAELQNAYATVYLSVGLDPYDGKSVDTSLTVRALARSLRRLWLKRGDGSPRWPLASSS